MNKNVRIIVADLGPGGQRGRKLSCMEAISSRHDKRHMKGKKTGSASQQ